MKKQLLLYILVMCSLTAFTQNNASLTERETIDYLKNKVNEIVGHYRTPAGSSKFFFTESNFWKGSNNKVLSRTTRKTNFTDLNNVCGDLMLINDVEFNPTHIKDILLVNPNEGEPVGLVRIILIDKVGRETVDFYRWYAPPGFGSICTKFGRYDNQVNSVSEIYIPFLASDPANFNRIKRALEHLRDLYKADDPFGD